NIEAFRFFQPFIEAGAAKFETAGALRNGKIIWLLAKLNQANAVIRANDEIEKYLLLANSHDGSLTVRTGLTPVRVVCANTLAMSLTGEKTKILQLRHTQTLQINLEKVQEIIAGINQNFQAVSNAFQFLATVNVNTNTLEDYIRNVFRTKVPETEIQPQEQDLIDAEETNKLLVKRILEIFMTRLYGSKKFDTWWEAYNAITEYLTHCRGKNPETRLDSVWFGNSEMLNRKALKIALDMASK
ncbi:MAG: DUF932 domain-containing protein, partial [Desulfobacteraceae bacterium]